MKETNHTKYLERAMGPQRKSMLRALAKLIKEEVGLDKFDGFLIRGNSGLLVGPSLADILNKGIVISRKKDDSHSNFGLESNIKKESRLIFLDDLISSGETRGTAREHAEKKGYSCVGDILYGQNKYADVKVVMDGHKRKFYDPIFTKRNTIKSFHEDSY